MEWVNEMYNEQDDERFNFRYKGAYLGALIHFFLSLAVATKFYQPLYKNTHTYI